MVTAVGIYARISLDQAGEGLGVARQVEDCTAKATALGWTIAEVYEDNDVSASSDAPRPAYARLLTDLEAERIKGVVVYDLDRLTRRPAELEAFIDLSDRLGIALANVSGDVDLTTAAGRMVARIKGAVARQEAERIGERVKRQKQQRLANGLPPGSRYRTFGYTQANVKKGIVGWEVIEHEAKVVRDVFNRVVGGESVNSVTKTLRDSGVLTVSGKPWTFQATTRMLESPIYAGLLSYRGEIVGPSAVPALITEAVYESAQGRQTKPAWNARKHLLSGIATCDACGVPMSVDAGAYACNRLLGGCGNVSMKAKWLDDVVNAYMSSMVMIEAREAGEREFEPVGVPVDPIAVIDRQISDARQANTNGDLALEDLLPMLKDLRAKRAKAVKAKVQIVEDNSWQPVEDYDNADLSVKRTAIRRHITAIMVRKGKPGFNKFDESRAYVLRPNGSVVPLAAINVADMRGMIPDYPVFYSFADRGDPDYDEKYRRTQ